MVVYADVLFIMNFSLDYLILYLVSKGICKGRWLGFCAFLCGVYSLIAVKFPIFGEPLFEFLSAVLVVALAFRPENIRSFCYYLCFFYLVSFVVCGMLYAVVSVSGQGHLIRGVVYFDYSLWQFFLLTLFCRIFLIPLIQWVSSLAKRRVETVCITNQGKCVVLEGMIDTGCSLHEPLTGLPVMVAEYDAISEVLSEEFQRIILCDGAESVPERIYQVPFSTIGKEKGMMVAFMPQSITVIDGKKSMTFRRILVGVVTKKLGGEQNYRALLPPVMTI